MYDVRDDTLLDLARDARQNGWWHTPNQNGGRGYLQWETEACEALNLQLLHLPGLLQTEQYMRALFSRCHTEQRVENNVAARLYRQRRLTDRDGPLNLVAIVDESALHWPIGGVEVMRAQLRYLVERAELDTVTLQVLRHGPAPHGGMAGSFAVLRFPDNEDPDVLVVDHPVGAIHIRDVKGVEEVKAARRLFGELRQDAQSPRDSALFIERVAREL